MFVFLKNMVWKLNNKMVKVNDQIRFRDKETNEIYEGIVLDIWDRDYSGFGRIHVKYLIDGLQGTLTGNIHLNQIIP